MTQASALNYAAFAALMTATALGYQSLWGLLFIYWTVQNYLTGHAFLLSEVTLEEDPALYWLIQIAWFVFAILLVMADILPGWD
ncbi:hypothetical protein Q5Y75_14650 [Ruegeria sp. 2205SS24-7]|uniref:hypothetical protein n=1 Tax=Ruegeria discodermiae TaxID=3064389 RepID=UPI002741119B|nr:hypothetical protein [Ruegeria sp. 2205SS24-7]MDP5218468.1 hypothetical protein [Ruegeria sp. 2205SS24-7]